MPNVFTQALASFREDRIYASQSALLLLAAARDGDLPNPDEVVAVPGKEGLTVGTPGEREAVGRVGPAGAAGHLGAQLVHQGLLLQVPDADRGASGGAQPIPEGKGGNNINV